MCNELFLIVLLSYLLSKRWPKVYHVEYTATQEVCAVDLAISQAGATSCTPIFLSAETQPTQYPY